MLSFVMFNSEKATFDYGGSIVEKIHKFDRRTYTSQKLSSVC